MVLREVFRSERGVKVGLLCPQLKLEEGGLPSRQYRRGIRRPRGHQLSRDCGIIIRAERQL